MKKLILISLTVFLFFNYAKSQIQMDSDGEVGIGQFWGGEPLYQFHVNGHAYISCQPAPCGIYFEDYASYYPLIKPQWDNRAYLGISYSKFRRVYTYYLHYTTLYQNSDLRIKENIRKIKNPLFTITQIRGVMFDYKREYYENSPEDMQEMLIEEGKDNIGVIAQELIKVAPELVNYNEESKLYEVNYVGLVPILVEAIKEQQLMIDSLQSEMLELKLKTASNNKSTGSSSALNNVMLENNKELALYQNFPNPFSESTQIEYYITKNTDKAIIYIYDMNGMQLKSISLHHKGNGNIIIDGGVLNAGHVLLNC